MTLGSAGRPVRRGASDPAWPVRAGPRHCGQSSASKGEAATRSTQTGRLERSMKQDSLTRPGRQADYLHQCSENQPVAEIRRPKSEGRNPALRDETRTRPQTVYILRISTFVPPCGISAFGFRISDFETVGLSRHHVTPLLACRGAIVGYSKFNVTKPLS